MSELIAELHTRAGRRPSPSRFECLSDGLKALGDVRSLGKAHQLTIFSWFYGVLKPRMLAKSLLARVHMIFLAGEVRGYSWTLAIPAFVAAPAENERDRKRRVGRSVDCRSLVVWLIHRGGHWVRVKEGRGTRLPRPDTGVRHVAPKTKAHNGSRERVRWWKIYCGHRPIFLSPRSSIWRSWRC